MEVHGGSRKTTRSGFGVSAPTSVESVGLPPKDVERTSKQIEQTSKQISWVLRRGARQAGVRMDSDGWVLISDLTQCMYFSDFTEKELASLMSLSNRTKRRYEIYKSQHGDMVRATWRDAEALHPRSSAKADDGEPHPRSSPKAEPQSVSVVSTAVSRSRAMTGSSSVLGTEAPRKYESPLVEKASPSSFRFKATAQEFRPMTAHYTPVARPARPALDFTPTPLRQNLFAGSFTPGNPVAVTSVCPSPWSEKSNLLAFFNEECSRVAAERRATATARITLPGERVTCSRYQRPAEAYLQPSGVATHLRRSPGTGLESSVHSRPQHGTNAQTAAKTMREEPARPEATSAELQLECSSLTGGRLASSDEKIQLARRSIMAAGFAAEDILCARLNDAQTACFVEVSIGGGAIGISSSGPEK